MFSMETLYFIKGLKRSLFNIEDQTMAPLINLCILHAAGRLW